MTRIPIVIILIIAVAGIFDRVLSPETSRPARDGSQVRRPNPDRYEQGEGPGGQQRQQREQQRQWTPPDTAGHGSLQKPSARDPAR